VDRDGTIYKTFDDTAWIYHLGIKGTNGRYDKASVAIEFANELGLALDGDRLYAFGMNTPNTVYTGPFFAFDWRDYNYFAQLDEAQVDAGIELTLDICRRHDIEPSFYYPSTTIDFPRCFQVATIVCHSNCRRDKTDLALPDWVYEKVEGAGIRLVRDLHRGCYSGAVKIVYTVAPSAPRVTARCAAATIGTRTAR
jgi:hypothetical protein